jgi:hypothetical protein
MLILICGVDQPQAPLLRSTTPPFLSRHGCLNPSWSLQAKLIAKLNGQATHRFLLKYSHFYDTLSRFTTGKDKGGSWTRDGMWSAKLRGESTFGFGGAASGIYGYYCFRIHALFILLYAVHLTPCTR